MRICEVMGWRHVAANMLGVHGCNPFVDLVDVPKLFRIARFDATASVKRGVRWVASAPAGGGEGRGDGGGGDGGEAGIEELVGGGTEEVAKAEAEGGRMTDEDLESAIMAQLEKAGGAAEAHTLLQYLGSAGIWGVDAVRLERALLSLKQGWQCYEAQPGLYALM